MKVIIDNLMTEYSRTGKSAAPEKPIVLLLPGWQSPAANFAKLIDSLTKKFSEKYEFIAVDFPGWPGSENPPHAWSVADYTDWTKKFLTKIGAKNLFAIIGHSFGGRVMLKGISREQFSAQKLVFMDVAGVKPKLSAKAKIIKSAAKISRILPKNFREKIGQKIASEDYKNLQNNPILRETFSRIVDEDLTDLMPKISQPSLLVWGREDRETPLADAQVFAKNIPDSHLEIIENAGHYVFLDQPEKVAKIIEEFLC